MDATIARWYLGGDTDLSAPDAWRIGPALAALSHDLRTPLNAILGFGQLLADRLIPMDDLPTVAADIVYSSEVLLMQVIDVLNLALLERTELPLASECVDVQEVVQRVLDRVIPALASRRQVMDYIPIEGLPPVFADVMWLDAALDRLLMEVQRSAKPESTLVVRTCSANGLIGITVQSMSEPAHDPTIPDANHTVGSRQSSVGTGGESRLGLILAHRAVSVMGGTIARDPIVGGNHGWTIWLPSLSPQM